MRKVISTYKYVDSEIRNNPQVVSRTVMEIKLDHQDPNPVYHPGSTVTGTLHLDVDRPVSCCNYKQICIQLIGRCQVTLVEMRGYQGGGHGYSSSECYVDLTETLWSSQLSAPNLAPGHYNWPFSFEIPPTAPSSFTGSTGSISYLLVGKAVTCPLLFNHPKKELPILVQQLVRITDSRLLQPVRREVQKSICCLCCASRPITLTVAVPKTGLLLGESFQLQVSLENGSNRQLTITASIQQHVVYYAQGQERKITDENACAFNSIEPHKSHSWDPTIQIPTTGLDIVNGSTNIEVTHTLNVTCRISRAFDFSTAIPLQLHNVADEEPACHPSP